MRMGSAMGCGAFLCGDGRFQFNGRALFGRTLYRELRANLRCPFAHSLEAEVTPRWKGVVACREATAIVCDG